MIADQRIKGKGSKSSLTRGKEREGEIQNSGGKGGGHLLKG